MPDGINHQAFSSGDVLLIRMCPHAHPLPRGFDHLPDGFPARRVLCSSRRRQTKRPAHLMTCRALCSGDVLLSHGLSPYYHRGCSVSLPCSEWERVVPLRYCHQSAEPHWRFAAVAATQARSRVSGDFGKFRSIALPKFRKNTIFNRHSQVANRKSFLVRWHLHTGFRKQIR